MYKRLDNILNIIKYKVFYKRIFPVTEVWIILIEYSVPYIPRIFDCYQLKTVPINL